ncbi:hypothetical protein QSJ18_01255 [Gordonia sp. ABSL1-1]|uniref:hypothetical protein n=1 Tax=Gordonia sp. ABSL1-1 TaxID=3053923 RepID=UPI0025724408|nr:hypothetical protein [Gordonia sp. ABSL1-1]MDL9935364.1 hypothetical protein [Gordonia sp. ABSL1-1]
MTAAVTNPDIDNRIAITMQLLADGADASAISPAEETTVLHAFFGKRNHDGEREAPMLAALLDAGADINHVAKKWGPVLMFFVRNEFVRDRESGPFYDVIFARPGVDFDTPIARNSEYTLRRQILGSDKAVPAPLLRQFMFAYEAPGGIGDPRSEQ